MSVFNKKSISFGRKGIGVDEIIGFDEKKVEELSERYPQIRKTIKKEIIEEKNS